MVFARDRARATFGMTGGPMARYRAEATLLVYFQQTCFYSFCGVAEMDASRLQDNSALNAELIRWPQELQE
jgi:hypothetical protein